MSMKHNKKQKKAKKRYMIIPTTKNDKERNIMLDSIGTKECLKLKKNEKKIPMENIFIKKH